VLKRIPHGRSKKTAKFASEDTNLPGGDDWSFRAVSRTLVHGVIRGLGIWIGTNIGVLKDVVREVKNLLL
jgi:hypothetical protein